MPHVSVLAVSLEARPFAVAIGVVAVCTLLVGLALSLPGRAPEGVILGVGTTLASMLSAARPHQTLIPLAVYAVTACGCAAVALAAAPPRDAITTLPRDPVTTAPPDPVGTLQHRTRSAARALRLGSFWLAVPAAVFAIVATWPELAGGVNLVACVGVFVLVAVAARRRGRDLSVGYVAGLMIGLAGLVASGYGQAAGSGAVLAYPGDLTGLIGLGCAARIGLDRAFRGWQRFAALSIGAATLVAVASAVAFTAATVGCGAYVIFRLRGTQMPKQLREPPVVSAFRALAPFAVLAALWVASLMSLPRGHGRSDFAHLAAFGKTGTVGRLFGDTPADTFAATGWLGMVVLVVGAALVVWRVTGPGLPLWVPVLGLSMLAGVLASGSGSVYGPSPAWVLALGAELWVFCHGLRPDRDVLPSPPLPVDS